MRWYREAAVVVGDAQGGGLLQVAHVQSASAYLDLVALGLGHLVHAVLVLVVELLGAIVLEHHHVRMNASAVVVVSASHA